MADLPTYALWLQPSGETAFDLKDRIHELSHRFKTPPFDPHITLLSGMKQSRSRLIQFTDTLAGSLSPFKVELTELGYRDTFYQSFFAKVKQTEDLIIAHQTAKKFFKLDDFGEYFPHLSLMYGHIAERKKRDLINTMGAGVYLSFSVHNLLLIAANGEVNKWEKVHTADFNHH